MTGPSVFLTTEEACAYLRRGREWLRKHRKDIGYCREEDGRIYYLESDLYRWRMKHRVSPPAEIGPLRRLPRGTGGSAGGINPLTRLPWGSPPAPVAQQRKARRV